MTASNFPSRTPQRFAWVLWLAMLLPMAQLAAALHLQSHWSQDVGTSLDHKATAADACGQCVAVASLVAGGAVSATATTAIASAPTPVSFRVNAPALSTEIFAGYRSRAPPAASH